MIKIYGNKISGSCQKVMYTCEIVKAEYEIKELDFQKDLKTDWYLRIHPAGKIPAMDDEGFILFESGAISKYVNQKLNGKLYPKDVKQQAVIDQWIDFTNLHVGSAMGKVLHAKVFGPMRGQPIDEKSLKEGEDFLKRFLPIIDHELSKHKYLGSNELSLADLALLSSIGYADKAQIDLKEYKHLTAWLQNIKNMEFYKKVHEN